MTIKPDLVIGLDSSTTGCKAIVWDRQGRAVAAGRSPLSVLHPRPDCHEQEAQSWWQSAVEALAQAVQQVKPERLGALCITHQRESFVPVDEFGQPLRNGILWMDERARPLLPELERLFGREHFQQVTGKPLSGNLTVGKIAWLRQYEPEVFARTARYLDVHAFLVQRLTGEYRTGWGCADPMGLFDMRTNAWSEEILAGVGARLEQMPQAYPPGTVLGTVTTQAAALCGLPAGLPVAAGLGDGQSAGLGTNITRADESYLSLGTSFISGVFGERYTTNRAFRTLYGGLPGSYFIETAILGGGYIVSWFIEHFTEANGRDLPTHWAIQAELEKAAQQVPPGSLGLMLVPYWNSAMGPYWDASASGIVVGWRGVHQRPHLYRAILEGIAFEQNLNTRGVEQALGVKIKHYVATGGGTRSDLWRQIVADITGKTVLRAGNLEAAALGAGILAASAAGLFQDPRQAAQAMVQVEQHGCEPDERRHACYNRLYEEVYVHLYPALKEYTQRLMEITDESC